MSEPSIDPSTSADPHADKYNDPRAQITRRGVLMGVGVVVLGILGAAASIYGRRTRLGETTRFWGPETITALQLAERVEMSPVEGPSFPLLDLSTMPGLGLLRRQLLDERSFDWLTENRRSVGEQIGADGEPVCVRLRLTDPTVHRFEPVEIDIDLVSGRVGPSGQPQSVQIVHRKRSGLRHFLETIMNKEQNRYDLRETP